VLQLLLEQLPHPSPKLVFKPDEKPNEEKSFFTSAHPQPGHSGVLPLEADINFSNFVPHLLHLNS